MDIRPIRNEDDYEWALAEVTRYFDDPPAEGTQEADRFDVLFTLVEAYEEREWRIEAPGPVEVLRTVMEMSGRTQSDLADLIGYRSRASEVLNGKRELTIDMIARISREWHIPAELLLPRAQGAHHAA